MPRYFFNVEPVDVIDVDAIDLPDHSAATDYARSVAEMLVIDPKYAGRLRIVVKYDSGNVIHEEPLKS